MLSHVIGNACFRARSCSILAVKQPSIYLFSKRIFADTPRESNRLESDRMQHLSFKESIPPEEFRVGEAFASGKEWDSFPVRGCLAALAAAVSYGLIRSFLWTDESLLSQWMGAIKNGSGEKLADAVSRIANADTMTRWGKVAVYQQGMKEAVHLNNIDRMNVIMYTMNRHAMIGSWPLSQVYQETLLSCMDADKRGMANILLGHFSYPTNLDKVDLSRLYCEGLKKAIEKNKPEFVSVILCSARYAFLFNKEDVAKICKIGLKRAEELDRSEVKSLILSAQKKIGKTS